MEQYPLNQSSWGRAQQDTLSTFHTLRFWMVQIVSAPIIAYCMYLAIPNSASTFIKTIVPIAAFSIWMLAFISGVFLLSLLIAPYRQRNEARALLLAKPKAVPLRNRESLIKAIVLVEEKAIALKTSQDWLNHKEKNTDDFTREAWSARNEARSARDEAHSAYLNALEVLETERLVAGDYFWAITDNLKMFINYHIYDCMRATIDKPATLKTIPFIGELHNQIEQTIRSLDALSLQVFDKEGSQT